MEKHFTLAEARALLARLRPMLERLQALNRQLEATEREVVALHWKARGNGRELPDSEFQARLSQRDSVLAEIRQQVARVQALGVEVKDLEMGLVDFPHLRDGRTVYLCWKLGEPTIAWWHEIEAGYAGRQPL